MLSTTIDDYLDRLYIVRDTMAKMGRGVDVNSTLGIRINKILNRASIIAVDINGPEPEKMGITNRLNSLERSVHTLSRNEPEDSEEEPTVTEAIPTVPIGVKTFDTVSDMVQEIAMTQSMLLNVYEYACKKNNLSSSVSAFITLKRTADNMNEMMREITKLGSL